MDRWCLLGHGIVWFGVVAYGLLVFVGVWHGVIGCGTCGLVWIVRGVCWGVA